MMDINAQDLAAALARAMIGLLFLLSGIGQWMSPATTLGFIASHGLPLPKVGYVAALVIELGLGTAFILGYQTRTVASVLGLFTLATALIFHHRLSDVSQLIHFLKNVAIAGGLLSVYLLGAGRLSLDALLAGKTLP